MLYYTYHFLGNRLFAIGYMNDDCVIPRGLKNFFRRDLQVHGGFFFAATDSGIYSSRDGSEWKDLGRLGAPSRPASPPGTA